MVSAGCPNPVTPHVSKTPIRVVAHGCEPYRTKGQPKRGRERETERERERERETPTDSTHTESVRRK